MLNRFLFNHARQIGTVLLCINNGTLMRRLYTWLCYPKYNQSKEITADIVGEEGDLRDHHYLTIVRRILADALDEVADDKGISIERWAFSVAAVGCISREDEDRLPWFPSDSKMINIALIKGYNLTPDSYIEDNAQKAQVAMDWYHRSWANRLHYRIWRRYDRVFNELCIIDEMKLTVRNPVMHMLDIHARLAGVKVTAPMLSQWQRLERQLVHRAAYSWTSVMTEHHPDDELLDDVLLTNRDNALVNFLSPKAYVPKLKGYTYPDGV